MPDRIPHVVILGGGFGGLYCARALRKAPVRITLIDRQNYHLFQPLLYQVATAALSPAEVASPIRSVLRRQENAEVWLGEAIDVDVENRRAILEDGEIGYDYLVVATGATHAYFGNDEWAELAPGLKTVDDALEIRRRFLLAFEAAEREADADARRRLLTTVIVGAGPTGVELAGAMSEIARQTIPRDFRFIDTTAARIILVEGTDRVLPPYPPDLSKSAREQLERLGVEVRTGSIVTDIRPGEVWIGDEKIDAGNVFWAAGVKASPIGARLGASTDRAGRVEVERDGSVPGRKEIFVVGDLAYIEDDEGKPFPWVAQLAIQMGEHAAEMIEGDLEGKRREPFRYNDKGSLATIGRAAAVADLGNAHFSGFIAWAIWALIHILFLIGFRNRIIVMVQWAWSYIAHRRGIRLITGDPELPVQRARPAAGEAR